MGLVNSSKDECRWCKHRRFGCPVFHVDAELLSTLFVLDVHSNEGEGEDGGFTFVEVFGSEDGGSRLPTSCKYMS